MLFRSRNHYFERRDARMTSSTSRNIGENNSSTLQQTNAVTKEKINNKITASKKVNTQNTDNNDTNSDNNIFNNDTDAIETSSESRNIIENNYSTLQQTNAVTNGKNSSLEQKKIDQFNNLNTDQTNAEAQEKKIYNGMDMSIDDGNVVIDDNSKRKDNSVFPPASTITEENDWVNNMLNHAREDITEYVSSFLLLFNPKPNPD